MLQVPGIDGSLNFKPHVLNPARKWKEVGRKRLKLGFYLRNKSCFSLNVRKYIIAATFFFFTCVGAWGPAVHVHGSAQCLHMTNNVYHS